MTDKELKKKFASIQVGELEDGTPYYFGTDMDKELDECVDIAKDYCKRLLNSKLDEWVAREAEVKNRIFSEAEIKQNIDSLQRVIHIIL